MFLFTPMIAMTLAGTHAKSTDPVSDLAAAERALAAKAVQDGFNEALAAFVADDGIIFRPEPVNGKTWLKNPEPFPAKLDWWPERVDVSCDGKLGWSTGPVTRDGNPPRSHYVTIWRKEADGHWRFVFDQGSPHPSVADPYPRTSAPQSASRTYCSKLAKVKPDQAKVSLFAADDALSAAARTDVVAAGKKWLAEDSRVHRFFIPAPANKEAALTLLASQPLLTSAARTGGEIAGSGDFGFTYGDLSWSEGARGVQKGYYFRIWRKAGADWQLVLDQIRPLDPPPPPGAPAPTPKKPS